MKYCLCKNDGECFFKKQIDCLFGTEVVCSSEYTQCIWKDEEVEEMKD